uniref:Uncharacterized protein n=1 Tax=Cacopsylla melanoneura TaxID=428564 RepID=A0A8D8M220_9HEMI
MTLFFVVTILSFSHKIRFTSSSNSFIFWFSLGLVNIVLSTLFFSSNTRILAVALNINSSSSSTFLLSCSISRSFSCSCFSFSSFSNCLSHITLINPFICFFSSR